MRQEDGIWLAEGWWSAARHHPSPNFGPRPPATPVSLIVLHNISLPPGEFSAQPVVDFFLNRLAVDAHPYFAEIASLQVSAHFYIARDGALFQFVGADLRAWHAGQSCWRGDANCNDFSIGIELEGCDTMPFEPAQYERLAALIVELERRYPIEAVVGHSDIAPGRKTDPGPFFDWKRLDVMCKQRRASC